MIDFEGRVVALCGGVGGAKLAYGLDRLIGERSTIVVNIGDDFSHLGLAVSPDIDTVVYTLGGLADEVRGWGRAGESWNFMDALAGFSGETWFRLGDRDLALHVLRTRALDAGTTLTDFTRQIAAHLGIRSDILPVSDHPCATILVTPTGRLSFQRYFVELQTKPEVQRIEFGHSTSATATERVLGAIHAASAIIICPSNPYLSIDPILAIPGVLPALETVQVPIVAVSPLVGGQAIKGPTAKIMKELGVMTNSVSIARHYPFLAGLVIDLSDEKETPHLGIPAHVTNTVMRSNEERVRLASECLVFVDRLRK